MKTFEQVHFCAKTCDKELAAFKRLLDAKQELSEKDDILPFFKKHTNLAVLIGSMHPLIANVDGRAHEYDLFGDFACDLVVRDSAQRTYVLLEFEDAIEKSVFCKGTKYTHEWGSRFEHGFSQLVDWFWCIEDKQKTTDFAHRFGGPEARFVGMLVVGRRCFLQKREQDRLSWRSDKVLVNSRPVICLTFDDLYERLRDKLTNLQQIAMAIAPAKSRRRATKRVSKKKVSNKRRRH